MPNAFLTEEQIERTRVRAEAGQHLILAWEILLEKEPALAAEVRRIGEAMLGEEIFTGLRHEAGRWVDGRVEAESGMKTDAEVQADAGMRVSEGAKKGRVFDPSSG